MNWNSWLLWGFVATVVLTTLLAGSQGMGMARMNVPYLLGTMVTPNRDRAKLIGVFLHFINGWLFSFNLCRRLPTYWKIDMVVRRADWISARKFCAGGGFTCSTRFASAHGQRAIRADRCAATGAAWFSWSALRHSHPDIGPRCTHDLWRDPRSFLRREIIVTSDD